MPWFAHLWLLIPVAASVALLVFLAMEVGPWPTLFAAAGSVTLFFLGRRGGRRAAEKEDAARWHKRES